MEKWDICLSGLNEKNESNLCHIRNRKISRRLLALQQIIESKKKSRLVLVMGRRDAAGKVGQLAGEDDLLPAWVSKLTNWSAAPHGETYHYLQRFWRKIHSTGKSPFLIVMDTVVLGWAAEDLLQRKSGESNDEINVWKLLRWPVT